MLLPAGVPVNFTAVFENATPANVAISIYDDTGSSPTLLAGYPALMTPVAGDTYRSKFTPTAGKLYIAFMAVYTSGAFSAQDAAFIEQVVPFVAQNLTPPAQSLVGVVDCQGGN